jgi:hypothetical protein
MSEWLKIALEALNLQIKLAVALALTTGSLLFIFDPGWADLPPYARPVANVVFVLALSVLVAGIGALGVERVLEGRERERKLAQLNHLTVDELRIVAQCLEAGTQSLPANGLDCGVHLLCRKGLARATPVYGDRSVPFTFERFAWRRILARREELLRTHEERSKSPTG